MLTRGLRLGLHPVGDSLVFRHQSHGDLVELGVAGELLAMLRSRIARVRAAAAEWASLASR